MNVWISGQHREDRLVGTLANLTRGPVPPTLCFYDGDQPDGGGAATHLVATVTLAAEVGEIVDGLLVLADPEDALVLRTGRPTWARFHDGRGDPSMDVDVSDVEGDGAIKLEIVDLIAGGAIRIALAVIG